jgi:hypothetical protein
MQYLHLFRPGFGQNYIGQSRLCRFEHFETSLEDFEEAHEHFNDAQGAHDTVDESDGSYDDRGHGQAMNF